MSKRKQNQKTRCALFPDDVRDTCRKPRKTSQPSWDRCGDSFLDTPVIHKLQTVEKRQRSGRQVCLKSLSGNADMGSDEPMNIAWSSSDDESEKDEAHSSSRQTHKHQSSSLRKIRAGLEPEDLPSIDSASDSEITQENPSKEPRDLRNIAGLPDEISDYSSSDEGPEQSRTDSSLLDPGESSKPSVSEWVRSAQAILQTPQKQTSTVVKTPEDSSKKRRRFERGGLAERLSRLHSRQRSAISFWRHQCSSSTSTAAEKGVLTLRIVGVREECDMQAAVCERLPEEEKCVALFNKDTAGRLQPVPGDIIHIYPPWQNLLVDGEIHPIILNTHFSQKVSGETEVESSAGVREVEKCRAPLLTRSLCWTETSRVSGPKSSPSKQTQDFTLSSSHTPGVLNSLLDAVEHSGPSGSPSAPVEVLVHRVYCLPISPQSFNRPSLHTSTAEGSPPESADSVPVHIGRSCALVQDASGLFAEVLLDRVSSHSSHQQVWEQLESRVCVLRGLRVVQRLTRDRCSSLFSLIDSCCPPQFHPDPSDDDDGDDDDDDTRQPLSDRIRPPSFCYRVSVQQGHVTASAGQTDSPLYRPPVPQTLAEILQDESVSRRCSFLAAVIHSKTLRSEVKKKEMLLVVTDPSLQDPHTDVIRRSVSVSLSASCLLWSSVSQALRHLHTPAVLSFRDALKENGQIFCLEQTVIQLESENQSFSIPRPIKLDHLSSETLPYSLCTFTGVLVSVDESSAFSWPVCRRCQSCCLKKLPEKPSGFQCLACEVVMEDAEMKMQMEVFVSCPSLSHCSVRVKLCQKTITSLLSSARSSEGFSVDGVLGMEIGPLAAFVHEVNRGQTGWMGLEELNFDPH